MIRSFIRVQPSSRSIKFPILTTEIFCYYEHVFQRPLDTITASLSEERAMANVDEVV